MMKSYTPSVRLFACLGFLALESLACLLWDWVALLWLVSAVILGCACLYDFIVLQRFHFILDSYSVTPQPTLEQIFALTLILRSQSSQNDHIKIDIRAIESDYFTLKKNESDLEMSETNCLTARWFVIAKERGNLDWPGSIVSCRTSFDLLTQWQVLDSIPLKVYPKLNGNLRTLLNPKLLLEQLGIKTHQFKRADQVFESLRPYVLGDSYKNIDWKATARSQSFVTRQFQMEQHHNIVICLDSSRLMGTTTEGVSKLDWAIEATLHLAYLSDYLKDRISLIIFSQGVDCWVKPHKVPVDAFLRNVYNVKPKILDPDFNQLCTQVLAVQKKRSLVIFLTDFIDASSLKPFLPSFARLNRKHSSLFIGIEDPAYKKHLTSISSNFSEQELSRRIVAQDSMNRRQEVIEELRLMGLHALSTSPETLVQEAMKGYLRIKMAGSI